MCRTAPRRRWQGRPWRAPSWMAEASGIACEGCLEKRQPLTPLLFIAAAGYFLDRPEELLLSFFFFVFPTSCLWPFPRSRPSLTCHLSLLRVFHTCHPHATIATCGIFGYQWHYYLLSIFFKLTSVLTSIGFFEKEKCASSVYVMTVVVLSIRAKEIKTIFMKCWLEHCSLNDTSSLVPQTQSVRLSYRLAASLSQSSHLLLWSHQVHFLH